MQWAVTCTRSGFDHLRDLAGGRGNVHLSYHGLDLARFGPFGEARPAADGSDPAHAVRILSVGRAVDKKGFDVLLRALGRLPADLHWHLDHVGGGERIAALKRLAQDLGLEARITWLGPMDQAEVLALYRRADLFALACRIAANGDRDGLPNVLVEAASQGLACVSTDVSGVPELIEHGQSGLIVPPENPEALAAALATAIRDPALRGRLGAAAEARVRNGFDFRNSIRQLATLFADPRSQGNP